MAEVKRDLSPQMREEADYFYSMFENRLVELAVDYPDHFDVEGFFRYVEMMAAEDFIFYASGREMSPSAIANMMTHPLRLLAGVSWKPSGATPDSPNPRRSAAITSNPAAARGPMLRHQMRFVSGQPCNSSSG